MTYTYSILVIDIQTMFIHKIVNNLKVSCFCDNMEERVPKLQ